MKFLKGFWNDDDGFSIKEYITVIIMTIYISLVIGTLIFSLIYQTSETYQQTYDNLLKLISIVDDPVKIIITAYFVTNIANTLNNKNNNIIKK